MLLKVTKTKSVPISKINASNAKNPSVPAKPVLLTSSGFFVSLSVRASRGRRGCVKFLRRLSGGCEEVDGGFFVGVGRNDKGAGMHNCRILMSVFCY